MVPSKKGISLSIASPLPSNEKFTFSSFSLSSKLIISFFLFFSLQFLIIYVYSNCHILFLANDFPSCNTNIAPFYIYDLPQRFNGEILKDCHKMHPWTDMCPYVANYGFGQPTSRSGWYSTNQFTLELIFHARTSNHPCRTYDPKAARLFYIPFYVGYYTTYMFHAKNHTVRDAMALDLANYMSNFSSFYRLGGHDHFIIGGRVMSDYLRSNDPNSFSYNTRQTRLLKLPEFSNVSVLAIERDTRNLKVGIGIPYPTYFHPSIGSEMTEWQDVVRRSERNHLWTFIGAGRRGNSTAAIIRSELLRQCGSSERCLLLDCKVNQTLCRDSEWIMTLMKRAHFCIQPPGDTWTRRSVFDSLLAGCIPVFFSVHTAYTQYPWYIPEKKEDWSILITPDKVGQIEQVLSKVPAKELEQMREVVIEMIPHVIYVNPNATQIGFLDAVDVALIELTKRVNRIFNVSK